MNTIKRYAVSVRFKDETFVKYAWKDRGRGFIGTSSYIDPTSIWDSPDNWVLQKLLEEAEATWRGEAEVGIIEFDATSIYKDRLMSARADVRHYENMLGVGHDEEIETEPDKFAG